MPEESTPQVEDSSPCPICGSPIVGRRANTPTCSAACAREHIRRSRPITDYPKLPPSTRGALQELVVCADLMRRGLHVFRAVSPTCPCDLMVYRDGVPPLRVEVRTARSLDDGTASTSRSHGMPGTRDVVAYVTHEDAITYVPDIFSAVPASIFPPSRSADGSVYQRKSDGLWVAAINLQPPGHKRKRQYLYGKSRAEVVKKLKRFF